MGIEVRLKQMTCHLESSERGREFSRRFGSDEVLLLVSVHNTFGKALGQYHFLKVGVDSGDSLDLDEIIFSGNYPAQAVKIVLMALELDGVSRARVTAEKTFQAWQRVAQNGLEKLMVPGAFGGEATSKRTGDDKLNLATITLATGGLGSFMEQVKHDLLAIDIFEVHLDMLRRTLGGSLPVSQYDLRPSDSRRVTLDVEYSTHGEAVHCKRRYRSAEAHSDYSFEFSFQFLPYQASYQKLPGSARDISVGLDNTAWVIGTDTPSPGNGGIYRLVSGTWTEAGGFGTRIAAGSAGDRWIVNSRGEIWGPDGQMPGSARDIDIGADSSIFVIGTDNPQPGNGGIYLLNGERWNSIGGYGVRIAVGPDGERWVVNSQGEIWAPEKQVPGCGRDIGIGADGSVYVIGCDNVANGNGFVYQWNGVGWDAVGGYGVAISVDTYGRPWVVNSLGEIWAPNPLDLTPDLSFGDRRVPGPSSTETARKAFLDILSDPASTPEQRQRATDGLNALIGRP